MSDSLHSLLKKAYELKSKLNHIKTELKDINNKIYSQALFQDSKQTAYLFAKGYKAKIVKKIIKNWDQEKLLEVKKKYGDKNFFLYFKSEYTPKNKWITDVMPMEMSKDVMWSMNSKELTPNITIDYLGDNISSNDEITSNPSSESQSVQTVQ